MLEQEQGVHIEVGQYERVKDLYKCPCCPCLFCNVDDLIRHGKAFGGKHGDAWKKFHDHIDEGHDVEYPKILERCQEIASLGAWRKGDYGGELLPADHSEAKFFVALIRQSASSSSSWVQSGNREYKLSTNGKWLIRRRADNV